MRRTQIAGLVLLAVAGRGTAGVIVVANYTPESVTIAVSEPGGKPQPYTIAAFNVIPIVVNGPAELKLPGAGKNRIFGVEPANAYVLLADRATGVRIEEIQLPGPPPEANPRPQANAKPRAPVTIPVTLMVDDADPRADQLWQRELRARFDEAAAILEAQTGFRFVFDGYGTWKSDPMVKELITQFNMMEDTVKVKPGAIAIGFTSRKLDVGQKEFGLCRGLGGAHILIREWQPKGEPERLEVLVRCLGIALGAVTSPDPGSVMRPKLGDGQALRTGYVIRLDPLNVLALNLLADHRRAGYAQLEAIPKAERGSLIRIYSALLQAFPADTLAVEYLTALDRDVAKGPRPGKVAPRSGDRAKRTEGIRAVVRALVDRAKTNTGPLALRGDALTGALVAAAAEAAERLEEPERVTAFLVGLGVALDDRNTLRDDPLTASAVADVENDVERQDRIALLDNPTMRNRRDFCRRFAVGCAVGDLLPPAAAENGAIARSTFDLVRPNYPAGFSFPALAAELSGIAFARSLRETPDAVFKQVREKFAATDLIPDTRKLPDCLGPDKFEERYGEAGDDRFKAVVADIRTRVQSLALYRGR